MNDTTAIARAAEPSGLEQHEQTGPISAGVEVLASPAQLREQIERQKQNYQVMKEYVESELVEGHHYGYMSRVNDANAALKAGEKPFLHQDGAYKILNLFRCVTGTPRLTPIRSDDGHFTVEAEVPVYNATTQLIATGNGMCSTRETKYAYRKGERTCPKCQAGAIRYDNKTGGWYCWSKIGGCGAQFAKDSGETKAIETQKVERVANPEIADTENTVLKMAVKRATVAAVRKLPLVSDLFSTMHDGEPKNGSRRDAKHEAAARPYRPKEEAGGSPAVQSSPSQTSLVDDPAEVGQVLGDINDLLKVKCGDGEVIDEDAARAFLKGRDPSQMPLDALKKLQGDLMAL